MTEGRAYDAVVVGAGPNGLAAAIELARAGATVAVLEAAGTAGGGLRSAELTAPGFVHDVCSAIHPLATVSPFFRSLPLRELGVEWTHSPSPLAHPLEDGSAMLLDRSVQTTAERLGPDGPAYRRFIEPNVRNAEKLLSSTLGPLLRIPAHPFALARFGLGSLRPARSLATSKFATTEGRALFAGMAAHAMLPLDRFPTGAVGLLFTVMAHAAGWPLVKGGSQNLADALVSYLRTLGGQVLCDAPVKSLADVPPCRAIVFDVTPRQLLEIAGDELPSRYARRLSRYRYGPGVFKVDWALDGPVPWKNERCSLAATVHLGNTLEEIAASEKAIEHGDHPTRPFAIAVQQSLFDPSRAPQGKHTLWAYCHVPNGSTVDMTAAIEAQIERFAPGFRERVLARSEIGPVDMERYNANYVGGDINGGLQDARQLFARPVLRLNPYSTPNPRIFLCSSSTPPGGGVHGMCGRFAAAAAARRAL